MKNKRKGERQIKTHHHTHARRKGVFRRCLRHPILGNASRVTVLSASRLLLVARRHHLYALTDDVFFRRKRVAEVFDRAQIEAVVAQALVLLPPVLLEAAPDLLVRHLLNGSVWSRPARDTKR